MVKSTISNWTVLFCFVISYTRVLLASIDGLLWFICLIYLFMYLFIYFSLGSTKLVRHLTMSAAREMPIVEIDLNIVLRDLQLSMDEFIDLCILCGW